MKTAILFVSIRDDHQVEAPAAAPTLKCPQVWTD
jgi:hypothetical protein